VYSHIEDSPYTTWTYNTLPVFLQVSSWLWDFKAEKCRRYCV